MAKERIIPIFVPHLGCPHSCVFCNQKRITGEQRPATAEDVINAIGEDKDSQVAFYGGSFTAIPECMQEELLSAASGHVIRLSTRPDAIDERTLERLKEYGVETIELGAQSMDDEVLVKAGRGHDAQCVIDASRMIQEKGFHLVLQMMTGLPGSSKEKDINTARRIAELHPDGVRVYPTVIVRDTDLYDMYVSGEYQEHTVEDAVEVCSEILSIFDEQGIPVIRLGLNPTDELSAGAAVAGAYHPALGELVKSRMLRNEMEEILEGVSGGDIVIEVQKNRLSQAIGQHRSNIAYLTDKYNLRSLKIICE